MFIYVYIDSTQSSCWSRINKQHGQCSAAEVLSHGQIRSPCTGRPLGLSIGGRKDLRGIGIGTGCHMLSCHKQKPREGLKKNNRWDWFNPYIQLVYESIMNILLASIAFNINDNVNTSNVCIYIYNIYQCQC